MSNVQGACRTSTRGSRPHFPLGSQTHTRSHQSSLSLPLLVQVQDALNVEEDGLYLYRHMLPPSVPGLAFVGSEVATASSITTSALQVRLQWPPPCVPCTQLPAA